VTAEIQLMKLETLTKATGKPAWHNELPNDTIPTSVKTPSLS
jgi:hypothetical protein